MKYVFHMRAWLVAGLAICLAAIAHADAPAADASSPEAVFAARGLLVQGPWLLSPFEKGVHDGVGEVKRKGDAVHVETTSRRNLKFEIQSGRHNEETLLDKLVASDVQLNQLITATQQTSKDDRNYPALIDMYNAAVHQRADLAGQVNAQRHAIDDATTRLGQVTDSRSDYLNKVMEVATQAESVAKAYAAMPRDQELAGAIARAGANGHPPKLGPTGVFTADLQFLRKAVKEVVDAPIPVKRDEGNELHVQAVINGTVPVEMLWDSGADLVVINADTAKQLGIEFTDANPVVETRMADGKTQKTRGVILESIRLGAFTVRHVPCFVLPDMPGTPPIGLLGDSFQTHFVSRMDQRSQQLQLTPVDSRVLVGAIAQDLQTIK
jgi:clan AA aspartic protease (TIGR02281 family)